MFYLYVFREASGGFLDAFIIKNNVRLAMGHVHAGYPHGDASVNLVVELDKSDRVYCRLSRGILYSHGWLGIRVIHFSGFLISRA